MFVVFVGKKQPRQVRKMPEIWNKTNLERDDIIFFNSAKSIYFEVLVSEFSMKSRPQSFNQVLVSKVMVLTTSLVGTVW